jgi:hypothetical protein
MFKDNAAALRRAARYLEKHRAINRAETIQRHVKPSRLRLPHLLSPPTFARETTIERARK